MPACRRAPRDREDRSRIDLLHLVFSRAVTYSARVPAPRSPHVRTHGDYIPSLALACWRDTYLSCLIATSRAAHVRSHALYGLVSVVCHRRRLSALIDLIASTEISSTVQLRRLKSHGGTYRAAARAQGLIHRPSEGRAGPWPTCCLERHHHRALEHS